MNRRFLTLLTLLLWGLLLVRFWAGGRIESYLHPNFHALVAASGFLLLALALAWWWATGRPVAARHDCGCHHEHEPEEERSALSAGTVLAFVLLLLPVSAAAIVSPGQFGEAAVRNRGIVTDISQLPSFAPPASALEDAPALADGEEIPDVADWPAEQEEGVEYFTRTADGAIQVETIDLLFAASEPSLREEFDNQRVSVVGQYVPPREGTEAVFDLVRMMMVCCAADARPLGLKVEAPAMPGVPAMDWVRVTGTAKFSGKGGYFEPRIEEATVEKTEPPREKILY